jgi:hypothetical protein
MADANHLNMGMFQLGWIKMMTSSEIYFNDCAMTASNLSREAGPSAVLSSDFQLDY